MDGWMGGWVDGWMGGWVDGWMEECVADQAIVPHQVAIFEFWFIEDKRGGQMCTSGLLAESVMGLYTTSGA